MENSHNGLKRAKTYENDNFKLMLLLVQLDKNLLTILLDFKKDARLSFE